MARAFQLKITLQGVRPQVWRRVVVPGNLNFERLHGVIQDAMGWEWCHLHEFWVGELRIGPEPDDRGFGAPVADEKQYTLERMFRAKGKFGYVYDFGDHWTHEIQIEEVLEADGTFAPRCVGGARACPPEDCGGVGGYQRLVRILANPRHREHADMREWVGDEWTAEAFDLALADRLVARHKPRAGRGRGVARSRAGSSARPG
jgi:hypothetical protein